MAAMPTSPRASQRIILALAGAGIGLRGLLDRVAALDGRLELHSPPGDGTRLRAEFLP